MDDRIVAIIWIVIAIGAGIWKLLSKYAGGVATVRKVAEAGKQSKSLLDLLTGDASLEDFLKPQAPSAPPKPPQEKDPAISQAMQRTAAQPEAKRPQPVPRPEPPKTVSARSAATIVQQVQRPTKRVEGIKPPVPAVAPAAHLAEATPTRGQAKTAAAVLGRLRSHDPDTLREVFLLREVLGPPKAFARRAFRGAMQ
jgi:outer membrane biosynthesis protein TonB